MEKLGKRFEGKVAIVTASTQGIGFGIAERLGLEGAAVVISSHRQKNVDEAIDKLKARGIEAMGLVCHVSNAQQRKDLVEKTVQKYGKIDVIVCNAAANPAVEGILRTKEPVLDKLWEINVKTKGNMGTYRWMAPEMIKEKAYTRKVDVYSFGIVLWELTTSLLPFQGMTPVQAAFAVAEKNERPPLPASCQPALAHLIKRCWAANPSKRPDFNEIVCSLEKFDECVKEGLPLTHHTRLVSRNAILQRLKGCVSMTSSIPFEDAFNQPDQNEGLLKLVDPRLGDDYPFDSVSKVAHLAKACTHENPQLRPSMRSIVVALMTLSSSTEDWDIGSFYENQGLVHLMSGR